MSLSSWHLRTGSVLLGWLLALLVTSLTYPPVTGSQWLLVHLLALGAASNAILIWSWYFSESVLRLSHEANRRSQAVRLALFNLGAIAVIAGFPAGAWLSVLAGGSAVSGVIVWHVGALLKQFRAAASSRFDPMIRYYLTAGVALPVGVGLGITMAYGALSGTWHSRLVVAHAMVNVLGWIGLTVIGTLIMLSATILRTRMADGLEKAADRGLPVLIVGLAVAVAGALSGVLPIAAAGVVIYAGAVIFVLRPHVEELRRKHPASYAAMSVLAGLAWLLGSLLALAIALATASSWFVAEDRLGGLLIPLAVGFLAQVLLGALSYLIPVVLGKRPSATQRATAALNRGADLRIAMVNAGLLVCVLPAPDRVRLLCSIVVGMTLAAFVPLVLYAAVVARRASTGPVARDARKRPPPISGRRRLGLAALGLAVVVLAAAIGVIDHPGSNSAKPSAAEASGHTTTVDVRIEGLRYVPATIEVPRGDRLVVMLSNTGDQRHDLIFAGGPQTALLAPGERATVDVGVIEAEIGGWCSVPGHRQMGMVMHVRAADTSAAPAPGFVARDPTLPPVAAGTLRRLTLDVTAVEHAVAPGLTQTQWVYGGTAPGPTLRGKVGDTFEVTLRNDASIGHSIDFHAGSLAPDAPMRTIDAGQSLVYRFTATHSGIWLYHCATAPVSLHMANGMYGAVIIDPPDLPPVAHEYVLVQAELFLGPHGGDADPDKLERDRLDLVVFNGYANQYDHAPLTAKVGERVRIWVLSAGPNRGSAFHVIGGQFDTVWKEGSYLLRPGSSEAGTSQVLGLGAAQGGFVEMTFPAAGDYPFITHEMVDAERGAHGIVRVAP